MGSEEIINFLKKNKKREFTTQEIAQSIEVGVSSVIKAMSRLLHDPFEKIDKRELTPEEKKNKYGSVVNVRVYVYRLDKKN